MEEEIAKAFHEKFIGNKFTENTMDIARSYVRFIIDEHERLLWEGQDDWPE